jgi:hypothetical protein
MDNIIIHKKEYDDDDNTYLEILKQRKYKSDRYEVLENEIENLKKEIESINEGYFILLQKLKSNNII